MRKCGEAIERPTKRIVRVRNGSSRWIIGLLLNRGEMHDLLLGRPTRQFAREVALPHHQDAVGHLQQLRQFGADHQDGCAGSRKTIHYLEDLHLRADVDAARRLVEQKTLAPRASHFAITTFC